MYLVHLIQNFEFSTMPGKPKPTTAPHVGFAYSIQPFDMLIKLRNTEKIFLTKIVKF